MAQYRKKPVVIEAIQFNGKNAEEIEQWSNNNVKAGPASEDTSTRDYLEIETLEGTMTAQLNDYIIKGVSGEFYPCKPDIFEKTYDAETTSFKERLIKEHEELTTCECNPRIEILDNGEIMVVHNSYDGREYIEELVSNINNN